LDFDNPDNTGIYAKVGTGGGFGVGVSGTFYGAFNTAGNEWGGTFTEVQGDVSIAGLGVEGGGFASDSGITGGEVGISFGTSGGHAATMEYYPILGGQK